MLDKTKHLCFGNVEPEMVMEYIARSYSRQLNDWNFKI